ncbi:MAG: glycosyltransferase family 4 protein [Candidatus Krumholzibacteria bacterium]|nr:glycosyltransferase family 4 protein [Candidatus Krumholzibacteria bacterium]
MAPDDRSAHRVLYHLRTQGTGSEGIHIRGMVHAFRSKGYEVDFLWPLGEGDPTVRAGVNPYERKRIKSPIELVVPLIPGPVFAILEYCYNFWSGRKFSAMLSERRYDLVYERHFFFSRSAGRAARAFRVPLVVEVNEIAGFERVRGNHLTGLARRCERDLFENATVVTVVSTFLKDAILRQYPDLDPGKICIVPNGVEEEFFSMELRGRAVRERFALVGKTVFGFVGFFLKVKTWHALEWFLPVFIEAVRERPDVVLMLVGEGPGRAELEEIGRSLGFSDRLIFAGEVPNAEIPHYLDAMDAGVIPHTNAYRSPIKMFEYMAAGKPMLAPRQEPVESIIGDIQGRFLFETKSAESLKNTITRMLEDRQSWSAIGEKLKRLARERFTYEKHGETILRLLEQRAGGAEKKDS